MIKYIYLYIKTRMRVLEHGHWATVKATYCLHSQINCHCAWLQYTVPHGTTHLQWHKINDAGQCLSQTHGPLTRNVNLRVAHAPGLPGTFSPPPLVSDPGMHHGTCATHVPWCMPGSLTSGFLWNRWRGKRSRHSRRMRNPWFYISGKRPCDEHFSRSLNSESFEHL